MEYRIENFKDVFINYLIKKNIPKEIAYEFCDVVKRNNVIITGSTILELIYDIFYSDDTDIDVIVNSVVKYNDNNIQKYITNGGKIEDIQNFKRDKLELKKDQKMEDLLIDTYTDFEKWMISFGGYVEDFWYDNIENGFYETNVVRNYRFFGLLVQVIHNHPGINRKLLVDSIFDFDICQNIFDGEKLYIKNLDHVLRKEIYVNDLAFFNLLGFKFNFCYWDYDQYRLTKNINNILEKIHHSVIHEDLININHLLEHYKKMVKIKTDNVLIRIEKYKSRRFTFLNLLPEKIKQ